MALRGAGERFWGPSLRWETRSHVMSRALRKTLFSLVSFVGVLYSTCPRALPEHGSLLFGLQGRALAASGRHASLIRRKATGRRFMSSTQSL